MLLSDATFYRLSHWMKEQTGVYLPAGKKALVQQRLLKRLTSRHLPSYEAYYHLLQQAEEELERITAIDLLTTHETYFFREPKHFYWLDKQLAAMKGKGGVSVWSAACSTGEEVWSIAMLLAENLGMMASWSLLGSDISQPVLKIAATAHYAMQRIEGLPPALLHKYCLRGVRQHDGTMLIAKVLRQRVQFRVVNLDQPLPGIGPFDIVFLRNVLIYFDQETKIRVVRQVLEKVKPGGYLLLSHSESLHGLPVAVELVQPGVYRKTP